MSLERKICMVFFIIIFKDGLFIIIIYPRQFKCQNLTIKCKNLASSSRTVQSPYYYKGKHVCCILYLQR